MQSAVFLSVIGFLSFFPGTLSSAVNSEVKGCSVSSNKENSNVRRFFYVQDYENNFPKSYESLRILSVFSWDLPVLGVYGDGNEWNYYFGNFNSSNSFALYRNHFDWYRSINPCDVVHSKDIFATKDYVEVEAVINRDGRFSIFVYGKGGFVLSCEGSGELSDPKKVDIGYAGKKNYNNSVHKFFYDCPTSV